MGYLYRDHDEKHVAGSILSFGCFLMLFSSGDSLEKEYTQEVMNIVDDRNLKIKNLQ
ncbi:hypothetical protein AB6878_02440 [Carnobacterium maltaromaticum]|uniref:hypothetical protein n=1 Tax=Carnobacterium maltaromaticum TaxID=2751 RepID=UPI0039BE6903